LNKRGRSLILIYLKKRKEKLRMGEREFPGSMHEGLLVITAIQVDPEGGSTGVLEVRVDLHS
jgi:hypothetical protein